MWSSNCGGRERERKGGRERERKPWRRNKIASIEIQLVCQNSVHCILSGDATNKLTVPRPLHRLCQWWTGSGGAHCPVRWANAPTGVHVLPADYRPIADDVSTINKTKICERKQIYNGRHIGVPGDGSFYGYLYKCKKDIHIASSMHSNKWNATLYYTTRYMYM